MQSGYKYKVLSWRLSVVSDENRDKPQSCQLEHPPEFKTLHLPNKPYLYGKTVTSYKQEQNTQFDD